MKQFTLTIVILCALSAFSQAGTEQYSGKEMKQVAPVPCEEYYADSEFNVSVWGTYAWAGTDMGRANKEVTDDRPAGHFDFYGKYDRFLAEDHAWGGGIDVKYFFARYFGVGIQGSGMYGHSRHLLFDEGGPNSANEEHFEDDNHWVGGVMGTLTVRHPFHCSRFSPYAWGGLGGYFGGSNDKPDSVSNGNFEGAGRFNDLRDENRFAGQFGIGLEVRITRHIGVTGDVAWNVLEGPHNDFGMTRVGLNFAF
jgi:hypothetical protein